MFSPFQTLMSATSLECVVRGVLTPKEVLNAVVLRATYWNAMAVYAEQVVGHSNKYLSSLPHSEFP